MLGPGGLHQTLQWFQPLGFPVKLIMRVRVPQPQPERMAFTFEGSYYGERFTISAGHQKEATTMAFSRRLLPNVDIGGQCIYMPQRPFGCVGGLRFFWKQNRLVLQGVTGSNSLLVSFTTSPYPKLPLSATFQYSRKTRDFQAGIGGSYTYPTFPNFTVHAKATTAKEFSSIVDIKLHEVARLQLSGLLLLASRQVPETQAHFGIGLQFGFGSES